MAPVFNNDVATINASTIADDNTSFDGGGIANDLTGVLALVNSTVAFNHAGQTGGGVNSVGTLTVINSTIAYNSVTAGGSGGGIDASSGNANVYNTIVAQNLSGSGKTATFSDVSGTLSAASAHNLIGTGGAGSLTNGTSGNLVGVTNPGLATTLANNGGPTPTIALLAGSPAIDAGGNAQAVNAQGSPLVYDQRGPGFARIVNGVVDIGAFERFVASTTIVLSSSNPSTVGQPVVLTARVSPSTVNPNTPTGTVTFYDSTISLGTVTLVNGAASLATSGLVLGANTITAIYSGDSTFATSTSVALTEVVVQSTTTTSTTAAIVSSTVTPSVHSSISTSMATVASGTAAIASGHHGKVAKKVIVSKKKTPTGGSSTKFHQTKQSAALKRSVAQISTHVKANAKKKK